jgi:hypothetical protein
MYLMVSTCPDIAFAVGLVSRFLSNPRQSHWKAVKQIMAYLKGTADVGLTFDGQDSSLRLFGFVDADWANDAET